MSRLNYLSLCVYVKLTEYICSCSFFFFLRRSAAIRVIPIINNNRAINALLALDTMINVSENEYEEGKLVNGLFDVSLERKVRRFGESAILPLIIILLSQSTPHLPVLQNQPVCTEITCFVNICNVY